jgi:hypothetical protein
MGGCALAGPRRNFEFWGARPVLRGEAGKRRAREGIAIVGPGGEPPACGCGDWVVQELVERPLMVDGRKIDFRCHVVVDTADRSRSNWYPPLFVRIAGAPHASGGAPAEITNCAFRKSAGLPTGMLPVEDAGLPDAVVTEVVAAAGDLIQTLLDARFARAAALCPGDSPRRVLIWGVDLIAHWRGGRPSGSRIAVQLLEVNVFPHLLIGCETCDPLVAAFLRGPFLELLMSSTRPI